MLVMKRQDTDKFLAVLRLKPEAVLLYVARDGHRARAVVRRIGPAVGAPARLRAMEFGELAGLGLRGDFLVFDWMGRAPQGLERAKAAAIATSRLKEGGYRIDCEDTLL